MTQSIQFYFFCIVLTSSLAVGCAYGPQTKDKTFLESLNGDNYEGTSLVTHPTLGSPIVKRRRANVKVSGRLFLNRDGIPLPLINQNLDLLQESKVLASSTSDTQGMFTLSGDFADGPAILRINSTHYTGERLLQIKGFAVEDVDFLIQEK